MHGLYRGIPLTLLAALLGVGCGSEVQQSRDGGDRYALSAAELADVENRQLTLHLPDACSEGQDPLLCERWLGHRDGSIGVTHHHQRVSFSIEEVDEQGRFRIAAYPDCNRDARIAAAEEARTPEPHEGDIEIHPYEGSETGEEGIVEVEGEAPPLLGDEAHQVVAPPSDGVGNREIVREALAFSPFEECRRLVVPSATPASPVELVDPATADAGSWWQVRRVEEERPVFVNTDDCPGGECQIGLVLDENEMLVAMHRDEAQRRAQQLMNLSWWSSAVNTVGGAVEDTWNSGVATVSQAAQSVGTVTQVTKLGNKNLYVSAATPAARLYDAAAQEGPQALSLANGVVNDGAVYAQIGASYATIAGDAILEGAVYIGEYIQQNACFLGVATGLSTAVADEAAFYEAPLEVIAQTFAEELATSAAVDALMADHNGVFYQTINTAASAIAIPTSLVSSRFNTAEWRDILIDILISALSGDVRGGFVGIIIGKLSQAICKGLSHALSPADAVTSVIHTNGIGDACLDNIKTLALERTNRGDDLCWAMRDEITIAAAQQAARNAAPSSPNDPFSHMMHSINRAIRCPANPEAHGYQSLLEGVGCTTSEVYLSTETPVDPSTVLNTDHQWTRTDNWFATLSCGSGKAAVGMCSSGGNPDCYGKPKELLCASRPGGGSLVSNSHYVDLRHNYDNTGMGMCPNGYVMTDFCSSGGNKDCGGDSQAMRCRPLAADLQIDYAGCTVKEAKTWDARLQATSPNDVIVGICTSGRNADCGLNSDLTKSALFCPIRPATNDGTHTLFQYFNGGDDLLTKYIGESPWRYHYTGSFQVYTSPGTNRIPLYRCLIGGDHFASLVSSCEGQRSEGLLGYISTVQGQGQPIYRCTGHGNHRITTDRASCTDNGYNIEGTLGYTP
ncbi:hypothetical protein FRC98_13170 [Lujinxingia vulgaris]|uniref:Uncharacterized protein n=1 Tax=Lujinxingia vulgaris TaxID=2600176 RepID=A0A5C6X8K0_9DELT|nr:hypothetical protein [Lujinxingia vulgaris]TXD36071.1 hypothetical protein FRC98_13170 [Lujinxingia vulgaris]